MVRPSIGFRIFGQVVNRIGNIEYFGHYATPKGENCFPCLEKQFSYVKNISNQCYACITETEDFFETFLVNIFLLHRQRAGNDVQRYLHDYMF